MTLVTFHAWYFLVDFLLYFVLQKQIFLISFYHVIDRLMGIFELTSWTLFYYVHGILDIMWRFPDFIDIMSLFSYHYWHNVIIFLDFLDIMSLFSWLNWHNVIIFLDFIDIMLLFSYHYWHNVTIFLTLLTWFTLFSWLHWPNAMFCLVILAKSHSFYGIIGKIS